MNRWMQFEEDSYRLPEGMRRIGYDADTQVYTFRDRDGKLYQGAPGADYGLLTPVAKTNLGSPRPGAFESDTPRSTSVSPGSIPSTFHDILPANLITATTSPVDRPLLPSTSPKASNEGGHPSRVHFVDVVRKSALPKMQDVVHNLRRSMTSTRRKGKLVAEGESLLRGGSSDLQRSASMATTRSGVSVDTPMRVS